MLRVIDVLNLGTQSSVTFEGKCEQIKNGSKIKDDNGNIFEIISVAMMSYNNPLDINKSTTVLINSTQIKKDNIYTLV